MNVIMSAQRALARPSALVPKGARKTSFSSARPSLRKSVAVKAVPVELFDVAAADGIRAALQPQADLFATFNVPEPVIHWGHPGNMAVVLLAMGGYGAVYLGWQIRTSDKEEVITMAKDMHPKLAGGMALFFAAGALGGMISLIMQDKPIFESTHVVTGLIGLGLLSFQALLPLFFAEDPSVRTAHAFFGSSIMALFVVHAGLGLQLGLSL